MRPAPDGAGRTGAANLKTTSAHVNKRGRHLWREPCLESFGEVVFKVARSRTLWLKSLGGAMATSRWRSFVHKFMKKRLCREISVHHRKFLKTLRLRCCLGPRAFEGSAVLLCSVASLPHNLGVRATPEVHVHLYCKVTLVYSRDSAMRLASVGA